MRGCKSKDGHRINITKDPEVQNQDCGLSEAWTPNGVKTYWFCCHQMTCDRCKRVVSQLVMCPDNTKREPQERRWR